MCVRVEEQISHAGEQIQIQITGNTKNIVKEDYDEVFMRDMGYLRDIKH